MTPKAIAILATLLLTAALSGCAGSETGGDGTPTSAATTTSAAATSTTSSAAMPQTHEAKAIDHEFTPKTLSIKVGDKVVWKNEGSKGHDVSIHKAGMGTHTTVKSQTIAVQTSTDYTFAEAGTYHVYCQYHSQGQSGNYDAGMVQTVTVA